MSSERTPLLPIVAPAAEAGAEPAAQLAHRRRRSPLTILTNVAKRVKGLVSSNGHAAAATTPAAPAAATTPAAPAATATPAPALLDAPLSARIIDAGSAFLRTINPFSPRLSDPPALPSHTDQELEQIVSHVAKDFECNQIEVNRSVIRRIVKDATGTPNAAALSAVCAGFLSDSWHQTDQHVQEVFGTVDTLDDNYTGVPEGIKTFYIRSKAMVASDMVILRDHFARRVHQPEFLAKLDAMIAQAEDNTVYLRYVGTMTGPRNPRDRFEEDLSSSSNLFAKVDLLIKDMREGGKLGNESEWSVHEFTRLQCSALGSSDLRTEFVERILIAIFGWDVLINVQRGGAFASYIPTAVDTAIGTSVVDNLVSLNISPGLDPLTGRADPRQHPAFDGIKGHFDDVFEFIAKNPQLVANRDVGAGARVVVDTLHQAIPLTRHIQGGTLVLLIGKDLPLEALDSKERDVRFLFSESRAGHMARMMLRQLRDLEQPQAATYLDVLDLFPFVNLYPWLLRHLLAKGSQFLAAYMQSVRPWVTVTFSGEVTRTIAKGFTFFGSFEGQGEAGRKSLLGDVGIPFLASFDPSWTADPTASGPAADTITVGIPHCDPGRDKYGSQPVSMRRVMRLTWAATFVLLDEAQRVLCGYEALAASGKGKGRIQTRLELCTEIERAAKARISSSGVQTALDQAKRDLGAYFQTRQPSVQAIISAPAVTEAKAARRVKKSIARSAAVANQFPAAGPAGSPARAAQANALWNRRLLPLGKHLPYNGDPRVKQTWMNWVMTRRQGVSLIQAALMRACQRPQTADITVIRRSLGLTDDDLKNPHAFEEAMYERLERMRQGRSVSAKFQQAQQSRALLRWGMEPQTILERSIMGLDGQEVQILDRMARFYTSVDGKTTAFRFNVPPAVQSATVMPILRFRDDGIHLVDSAGTSLHVVRVSDMRSMHGQGLALMHVWQRELTAVRGPAAAPVQLPPAPPGGGQLKYASKGDNFKKVAPIARDDAIWLFREWLDERFPNAGNRIDTHWRDPANAFL
ncbi:hypothetical protein HDU87_005480 [Geranomyces variabilis]|uniref:Uncharacterized protein n=1 Tax=Geranomyces variabilis TaxID=109894 RepID=A0AAD5THG3_9FUNG|nr:hypothetical protein HDU87_005480 [Geranomyces variabilis]